MVPGGCLYVCVLVAVTHLLGLQDSDLQEMGVLSQLGDRSEAHFFILSAMGSFSILPISSLGGLNPSHICSQPLSFLSLSPTLLFLPSSNLGRN